MRFLSSIVRVPLLSSGMLVIGLAYAAGASAQTSQAPTAAPSATPRVGNVPTDNPNRAPVVGATARHLLEAQASGRVAAPAPPMYGATASLSWKRYVDSFSHPIPEFFESRVGKATSE